MPQGPELNKTRQEIDYSFAEWSGILQKRAFKRSFPDGLDKEDVLSRPPKGYSDDNPAIDYLKMKSFLVTRPFTDAEVLQKSFQKEILKTFESMIDFVYFLNRSFE